MGIFFLQENGKIGPKKVHQSARLKEGGKTGHFS